MRGSLDGKKKIRTRRDVVLLIPIALGLIGIIFILNDLRLAIVSYDTNTAPVGAIAVCYVTGYISLFLLLQCRNKFIRTLSEIIFFGSVYTDLIYLMLGNYPFSYPDALNIFNNPGYTSGAIISFKIAFLLAFLVAIVVYLSIRYLLNRLNKQFPVRWSVASLAVQVVLFAAIGSSPAVFDLLPGVYRVPGNLIAAGNSSTINKWRRTAVSGMVSGRQVKHVFLIVDESISAGAVSLNGLKFAVPSFLQASSSHFINYGAASSFTNYSAGSNISLVSGLRHWDLPDTNYIAYAKSNIFQFAKNAGYRTYFIDGQSINLELQNFNSIQDLDFIDWVFRPRISLPSLPVASIDSLIATTLATISDSDYPSFVYVNKSGAHWPYHQNFPADSLNEYKLESQPGVLGEGTLNYLKSVIWTVDRFWQTLLNRVNPESESLFLYTSDHGENYLAKSYKVKHASIYEPARVEGMVPLFVFDQARFYPAGFRPSLNRYSHEYIFPTLLSAMGYEHNFITDNYGRTLADPAYENPRWFLTGDVFGRGKNYRFYVDNVTSSSQGPAPVKL